MGATFKRNMYLCTQLNVYDMAQFFLRTKRETGESPLYTKIRRNGMQMYICTGIRVDIQEWNKSQKSLSAMRRYENTDEGARVHDLQINPHCRYISCN